ncbi:MAG: 6-phosphogluconolactonase [Thermodesulfobacteriota bacterium]|nr:MAG: 6-phosphogluconolactonase [Thermodesulfobacteriota bacterium]
MNIKKPEIIVCKDEPALYQKACNAFVKIAGESIRDRGSFNVALSGGRTPAPLYECLCSQETREKIDWARVNFFWGDERCVPPDDAESNFRMAKEKLLNKLNIPEENIHRIKGELGEQGAHEYEEELKAFFQLGAGQMPRFDLVLLGMGGDGHIASLFPGGTAVSEEVSMVAAQYVEKLKALRITLTPPVITSARNIIFLVKGREKSPTLYEVLRGKFDPVRLPAQLTFLSEGSSTWFVDKEAALLLKDLQGNGAPGAPD